MARKINSFLYTEGKFGKEIREIVDTDSGTLYSHGKYKTKIKKEDLPEDYIKIHSRSIWYMNGYLKTAGIVDLQYKPTMWNHLFKDDYIYISYKEKIREEEEDYGAWKSKHYVNYDVSICGNDIVPIILAAEKNNPDLNLQEVKDKVNEKAKWYKNNYCDELHGPYEMVNEDEDGNIDVFHNYVTMMEKWKAKYER